MRRLTWTESADRAALAGRGCEVIEFSRLRRDVVAPALRASSRRESMAAPARDWLSRVAHAGTLAVLGVQLRDLDDLTALHGYVLEPALRSSAAVVIESRQRLTRLPRERFIDPQFNCPYTLERAIHAATLLYRGSPAPAHREDIPPPALRLDAEQERAVLAHDGVVQVIAPAGSGKTAVLIERVRELLRRGAAPERILCTTFNRDARLELGERLRAAGLGAVDARTFHSIGWRLMREERLARPRGVQGQLSLGQWKRLCAIAARDDGVWIEPADARAAIGAIKLGLLATPTEFRAQAGEQRDGPTIARIYELYERHLAEQRVHDFDDLVFVAVRALREDDQLRSRWQSRCRYVLIDEYQDIEPAQELLVRILAAPEDGLFCVGDEDQTLYGWRRASVRRIIELDLAYPALERVSLAHNYRCPPEIVTASRSLIEHNQIRFPKPIAAQEGRPPGGEQALQLHEHADQSTAAGAIARIIDGRRRGEIVVLARTTNLLRTVALACAELAIAISAPEQVFEPHGARGALEAYLRLCGAPDQARPEDVALVCRMPSRGLPFETEAAVAARLRAGLSFAASLADLEADARRRAKLDDAGRILDALAGTTDARRFIRLLRTRGGLDEYFAEYEQTFGGTEQIELEVLEQAEREAAGRTVAEYAALLQTRSDRLRAIRDDANGIEVTTIHRAKGREWPEVHLFACEEGQLPHSRALEVDEQQRAAGEGLEAERRLAYVAFTRAAQRLAVHTAEHAPSRFLTEARLQPSRPYQDPTDPHGLPARQGSRRRAATLPPRRGSPRVGGQVGETLAVARRVGLGYALRTARSRDTALVAMALALDHLLVGVPTASTRMTIGEMLEAIPQFGDDERAALRHAAGNLRETRQLSQLSRQSRAQLINALLRQASDSAAAGDGWLEPEAARAGPLADGELDDAIVRLVSLYPGRLSRPRIAHILAGHRGRKIRAKYSHLPEYGWAPFASVEEVRRRVARLLQTGRLEQRGENPPRLVPAGGARRRRTESGGA